MAEDKWEWLFHKYGVEIYESALVDLTGGDANAVLYEWARVPGISKESIHQSFIAANVTVPTDEQFATAFAVARLRS